MNEHLENVFEVIKQIIAYNSDIRAEEIHFKSSLRNDLSLDSVSAVEIILEIEEEFELEIKEEDIDTLETVEDLCNQVLNILNLCIA